MPLMCHMGVPGYCCFIVLHIYLSMLNVYESLSASHQPYWHHHPITPQTRGFEQQTQIFYQFMLLDAVSLLGFQVSPLTMSSDGFSDGAPCHLFR